MNYERAIRERKIKLKKEFASKSFETEYDKLIEAEQKRAHTIEITIVDEKGQPLTDLYYQGCAFSIKNGVAVFYGADDGSDDKVVSIDEFNKKFKITNVLF